MIEEQDSEHTDDDLETDKPSMETIDEPEAQAAKEGPAAPEETLSNATVSTVSKPKKVQL